MDKTIKTVFGLVENKSKANSIITDLLSAGINKSDISYLLPNKDVKWTEKENMSKAEYKPYSKDETEAFFKSNKEEVLRTENTTKAPEGAATGGTIGGIIGGSLGLLAGIGMLAIPGMGPFIAAGPIISALSGSGVGGGLGLLIGSIVGAGIPEYEAKKYEAGLKQGNILISVAARSDELADRAYEIMKKGGAKDLSKSSETVKMS
jgi:hypothetical protein